MLRSASPTLPPPEPPGTIGSRSPTWALTETINGRSAVGKKARSRSLVVTPRRRAGINLLLRMMRQKGGMTHSDAPRFFTLGLAHRGDDVLLARIDRLREAMRATQIERPFALRAWVVLPDHLHVIWALPAGDSDHAGRWRQIKARFSRAVLPRNRRAGLWLRGFSERALTDDAAMAAHMRFCHKDPALHGLVPDGADWPWSSFYRGEVRVK